MSETLLQEVELVSRIAEPREGCQRCKAAARSGIAWQSEDELLVAMERAFRANGGLACGNELASMLRGRCDQPVSLVARWIVWRAVVQFDWGGKTFIPLFQFDARRVAVVPEVTLVINELRGVFDNWELAVWFVQPNCSLGNATPLDRMRSDGPGVLDAARLDRFVVRG